MRYKLGDFTVKNWNDWDRVPRDPIAVGNFIIAGLGASTSSLAVITFVGNLAISLVTSWALAALAPKPDLSSFGSQGTLVNTRDAAAPADFVYGEVRKGGVVTYYESTGEKNKFLHQIIVLAGHEIEEIGDLYVNDEVVTWDEATGFVTSGGWGSTKEVSVQDGFIESGRAEGEPKYATQEVFTSHIRIRKFHGDQIAAPSELLVESELEGDDALTSNFVGNGIAYLYVRYEYDSEVFANSLPLITAKVKGKKVYDPRDQTTAYSDNAALCIRDFITSEYGLNDNAIDEVSFSVAANESDELVTLDGGGTEPRYTMNGIVKASSPIGSVLGNMSTACAGTLFWGSGYWKLKVGVYSAPVKSLTLDDLRGPINLSTRTSMRDSFNGVSGTFINAADDYISADYPVIKSGPFKAEDGGEELLLDLPLPFTTSASAAQRIAKLTLFRGREQMAFSADFGLNAFDVEVGDIVSFTNDRYGFNAKEFEVLGWAFASNQDAGDLRVTLTLQETSAAAFAWDAEESQIISNNTNLPDPFTVEAPTNLLLTNVGFLNAAVEADGTFVPVVEVTWDASPNAFVDHYEVEWRWSLDLKYSERQTVATNTILGPLEVGTVYQVRVRAVSALGVKSVFTEDTILVGGDLTAPDLPTSFSAFGNYNAISLSWENPTDKDFKQILVFRNTTDNSATSSRIGAVSGEFFLDDGLPDAALRYYWLKSEDYSGNISAFTPTASATTKAEVADATNSATAYLYRKNTSAVSAPTLFTGLMTYNFSTGVLTTGGSFNGWTQSAPSISAGEYLWRSEGFFASDQNTANLNSSSFTTPAVVGASGVDGDDGLSAITVEFTNPSTLVEATSDGTVSSYTGTGGFFRVYEGETLLPVDTTPDTSDWYISNVNVVLGSITTGSIQQVLGNTSARVFDHSNLTTDTAVIQYTISGKRSNSSSFTLTVTQTIAKVREGADGVNGTDGTDGTDGADGENAVGVFITNPAHTVPAGKSGVVTSYAGSGTEIYLYDGDTELLYRSTPTTASGYWWITATSASPLAAINVGSLTDSGSFLTVGDHSSMDVGEDVVSITYSISYKKLNGATGSTFIKQTITKSSAGADGAGRWNIPVATLPTTSAQAQSAWDSADVAGRAPVESDQAWYYTGTEANPTSQSVWLYNSSTSSWNEQEEVIDGDLLVTGTVTSDKVVTNFIDAFTINANNITTGTLTADRINIDNITLDTNLSNELVIRTAGVDTNELSLNSVTIPTSAAVIGSSAIAVGGNATLGTTTIPREGGPMRIQFDFSVADGGASLTSIAALRVQILRGTTVMRTLADIAHLSLSGGGSQYRATVEDPARTGSNDYSIKVFNLAISDMLVLVGDVSIFTLETKR